MIDGLKPMLLADLKPLGDAKIAAADDADRTLTAERAFRQKFERRSTIHALHVRNAMDVLQRLPDENEVIHVLMAGSFHGWSFVPAVLGLAAPATIKTLYVATLGFSDANAGELIRYLDDGRIRNLWFNCSCYMRDSSSALFVPLAEALRKRGQKIRATRNHAKLLCFEMTDGRHFVVDGSMNLRSCKNSEQANVTQSRELFDFYAAYIRDNCQGTEHVK